MTDQNYPTAEESLQVAADAGFLTPRERTRLVRFDGAWVFCQNIKQEGEHLPKDLVPTLRFS